MTLVDILYDGKIGSKWSDATQFFTCFYRSSAPKALSGNTTMHAMHQNKNA
jgi:hypothetical protein